MEEETYIYNAVTKKREIKTKQKKKHWKVGGTSVQRDC